MISIIYTPSLFNHVQEKWPYAALFAYALGVPNNVSDSNMAHFFPFTYVGQTHKFEKISLPLESETEALGFNPATRMYFQAHFEYALNLM